MTPARNITPRRQRSPPSLLQIHGQLVKQPLNTMLLDIGDSGPVDTGRAPIGAHLPPRPLQDVPAEDLVIERVEPSPGSDLGRPVKRPLQFSNVILLGGPSHLLALTSPFLCERMNEAAALPSPRVLLSRGLKRYYGRLRRPPSTHPRSRQSRL